MVRIALVAEGITDYVVLRAAMESMLNGRTFDLKLLQPEESVAFTGQGNAGPLGGGWRGVYKWCLQAVQRGGGALSGDPLFSTYDMLVLHVDADVAGEDPANYKHFPIPELAGFLPCEKPCPPPNATTDALRDVLLSWVGEKKTPPKTVLCTPSKSTEAWVVAFFFPKDPVMAKKGWECHPKPENRLGQQTKKFRFGKNQEDYEKRSSGLKDGWKVIAAKITEAQRFQGEFQAVIKTLPP
jgi:hypothetical protein